MSIHCLRVVRVLVPHTLCSLSFIAMVLARCEQLAPFVHSVSRCSQPWRKWGAAPIVAPLATSTAIHPGSSGLQG